MNSTARRWERGLGCKLARRREAGWSDVITKAWLIWGPSGSNPPVPVAAWLESALCDPVKMVFTDSS